MILLDTNVLSEQVKSAPDSNVITWLKDAKGLFISSITIAEMRFGIARMPDGQRKYSLGDKVERTIAEYRSRGRILVFDEDCASRYAEIAVARQKMGKPIDLADGLIAAICLAHGFALATRNEKDFSATGLQVVNPWAAEQS